MRDRATRPLPHRTAVAGIVAALLVAPVPAHGHASSEVPHARIAGEGSTVTVRWDAAPDDAADVGVAIGLLPEQAVEAHLGGPVEHLPTEDAIDELSRSPELRAYLLEHIEVRQDGHPCAGRAEPASDFVADGATLTFSCPDEVSVIDLRITMLHDRDPTYRTFGVDGGAQTTAHTSEAPEHTWDVTATTSGTDPSGDVVWLAGGVAVTFAAIVALLVRRPPRHRIRAVRAGR